MWCDFMCETCKCFKCEYICTECVECRKEKEEHVKNK